MEMNTSTVLQCAAGSYEGSLFGWDMLSNDESSLALDMTFGFHCCYGSIRCMAVSPNGKYMVCGGTDEMIRIFDMKTKKSIGDLLKHTGSITSLEFVGNGFLLSASEDATICIWRVADWQCLHILGGHKSQIYDMSVHPSGKVALSVGKDNTIRLWNLITGKIAFTRNLKKCPSKVQWNQHGNGNYYLVVFDTELINYQSADNAITCTIEKSKYVRINQANYCANQSNSLNELNIVVLFDDRSLHIYNGSGTLISSLVISKNVVNEFLGNGLPSSNTNSKLKDLAVCKSDIENDSNIVIITTNGQLLVYSANMLIKQGLATAKSEAVVDNNEDALLCCMGVGAEPRFTCVFAWTKAQGKSSDLQLLTESDAPPVAVVETNQEGSAKDTSSTSVSSKKEKKQKRAKQSESSNPTGVDATESMAETLMEELFAAPVPTAEAPASKKKSKHAVIEKPTNAVTGKPSNTPATSSAKEKSKKVRFN